MPSAEAIAAVKASLAASDSPAPSPEAATDAGSDSAGKAPPKDAADAAASEVASAPASEAATEASAPAKELASPRIAAALRAETRAQRMMREAERAKESTLAELRAMREEMARERKAFEEEISVARKLREDPRSLAEEMARAGDPIFELQKKYDRELAELREWKATREKAEAEERAARERESKETAVVRTVAAVSEALSAADLPNFKKLPERMRKLGITNGIRSGKYETVQELAEALESGAKDFLAEWESSNKPATADTTQQGTGNGTQAGKPGSTKVLGNDLSASTSSPSSAPLTREQRAAQLKADLAREKALRESKANNAA